MNDNPESSPNLPAQPAGRLGMACCLGVQLTLIVTILAVWRLSEWSLVKSFLVTVGVYWAVMYVLFITKWLHAKSRAGRLLLDCTEYPHKRFLLLLSAVWGFLAVLSSVAIVVAAFYGKRDWQMYLLCFALYFASSASLALIMALGRLQIVENGIWRHITLLEWDRIQSYDWQGEEELTLMLKLRRGFSKRDSLPIPLEDRDAVDELLLQYVCIQQGDFRDTFVDNGIEERPFL